MLRILQALTISNKTKDGIASARVDNCQRGHPSDMLVDLQLVQCLLAKTCFCMYLAIPDLFVFCVCDTLRLMFGPLSMVDVGYYYLLFVLSGVLNTCSDVVIRHCTGVKQMNIEVSPVFRVRGSKEC